MYLINRKILLKNRPFGMAENGRKFTQTNKNYKYGYSGHEKDNEIKGEGNSVDMGGRMLDTRLGRTSSPDAASNDYSLHKPLRLCNE
jgi:hypothetical protein